MNNTKQIKKDADMATELVKSKFIKNNEFSEYDSIYAFTNENIKGYFNKLNMEQNDILTVAGSGDHIFESLLRTPKSIKAFDINRLTKYYIGLKETAIRTLELNEFITFFCRDKNYYDVFNEQIYKKIRANLQEQEIIFWDYLYSRFPGQTLRTSNLFHDTEESYKFLKHSLYYFQSQYYNKLKEILIKQREENRDVDIEIFDITKKQIPLNNKFDIILLSNIADYLEEFYDKNHLENFKNLITQKLNTSLNHNGIICAAYLFWAYYLNQRKIPLIERDYLRSQYFKDNFEEWMIDNSTVDNYTKDYVLIYKKTNK